MARCGAVQGAQLGAAASPPSPASLPSPLSPLQRGNGAECRRQHPPHRRHSLRPRRRGAGALSRPAGAGLGRRQRRRRWAACIRPSPFPHSLPPSPPLLNLRFPLPSLPPTQFGHEAMIIQNDPRAASGLGRLLRNAVVWAAAGSGKSFATLAASTSAMHDGPLAGMMVLVRGAAGRMRVRSCGGKGGACARAVCRPRHPTLCPPTAGPCLL